jgi:putative serine protease PepD
MGGGVSITEVVAGSPADDAGLKEGDVVTRVDGQAVSSGQAVADAIAAKHPGDRITFTVRRDGQEKDVIVTLGERTGG